MEHLNDALHRATTYIFVSEIGAIVQAYCRT